MDYLNKHEIFEDIEKESDEYIGFLDRWYIYDDCEYMSYVGMEGVLDRSLQYRISTAETSRRTMRKQIEYIEKVFNDIEDECKHKRMRLLRVLVTELYEIWPCYRSITCPTKHKYREVLIELENVHYQTFKLFKLLETCWDDVENFNFGYNLNKYISIINTIAEVMECEGYRQHFVHIFDDFFSALLCRQGIIGL
jgi:hypothetical protein